MQTSWLIVLAALCLLWLPSGHSRLRRAAQNRRKKRGRDHAMNETIFQNYIGKACKITCSNWGGMSSIKGQVLGVKENWMEIQTRSGSTLLNTDYIVLVRTL